MTLRTLPSVVLLRPLGGHLEVAAFDRKGQSVLLELAGYVLGGSVESSARCTAPFKQVAGEEFREPSGRRDLLAAPARRQRESE